MEAYRKLEEAELITESDDAFKLKVYFAGNFPEDVWFPKSQIETETNELGEILAFYATEWIIEQKQEEFEEYLLVGATISPS